MSEPRTCAMEGCTCVALEGKFCGEYCERTVGHDVLTCGCGHKDCAGTAEELEAV